MLGVTKTDRIMWFSMWFLASIASFGIAFFPMIYLMIKRRNNHFQRHNETERNDLDRNKDSFDSTTLDLPIERNTKIWTLSIFLIFPIFIITYFLSKDLIIHEKLHQKKDAKIFHNKQFRPQEVSVKKYLLLTLFTLGVGIIYWLYKTMNMYNSHFIHQEKIEGELTKIEETKSKTKSV